jgi:hypothetical protein
LFWFGLLLLLFLRAAYSSSSTDRPLHTTLLIRPLSDTPASPATFAITNGIAQRPFFTGMPTAVGTLYSSAKPPVAIGMVIKGWTGGYFARGSIAGHTLLAYSGKNPDKSAYRPAIFYAGSMALDAAGFALTLRLSLSLSFRLF